MPAASIAVRSSASAFTETKAAGMGFDFCLLLLLFRGTATSHYSAEF
jgi:hypothetical protein